MRCTMKSPPSNLLIRCICAIVLCSTTLVGLESSYASHFKSASKEKLEEVLQWRLYEALDKMGYLEIRAGKSPRVLSTAIQPLPKNVKSATKTSSMLSVLLYDGKQIVYDWRRSDIDEDLKIYSMSMSKSVISYLVGKAYCDGRIESLEDPLGKYIPDLKGSYYANVKIFESLDMAAGDRKLYGGGKGGIGGDWDLYFTPIYDRTSSVLEIVRALGDTKQPKKKKFKYTNANPDLLGIVLVNVSPEGFSEFVAKALADPAGLEHSTRFLTDSASHPLASHAFYATRKDWMRIGIKFSEDFNSEGCIGDYLRSAVSEPVRTRDDDCTRYGKFFWLKCPNSSKSIQMKGHGGQRAIFDPKTNQVLMIHSIRHDYNKKGVIRSLLKKKK